jgi:hypothetical protein
MSRIHSATALPALLLLAACASQPSDQAAPPSAGACDADAAQAWIGKPATEANVDAAFKASGAKTLRALKPGQPMTMDYRIDRVNVLQDAAGNIEKISCG